MKKIFLILFLCEFLFSHDLWLSVKKVGNDSVKIIPVITENFPKTEELKKFNRFRDLKYFDGINSQSFEIDSISFLVLQNKFPIVSSCTVLPRDLTFPTKIANHYLVGEIGLTKEEIKVLLAGQKDSITENYRRCLKVISFNSESEKNISDFNFGLEREIVISEYKIIDSKTAKLKLKLFSNGQILTNKKIRILEGKRSRLISVNENGIAECTIKTKFPILFSFISFWKTENGNFESVWTNLSLVKI